MAITDPDVGLLTSSAQIFASNHTLPQIRQIHKALHVQVDDKAARLRTQVGGSYRELLGTADAIVQMRSDMDEAQAMLAGMGARCGRAVVGGKVTALAAFVAHDQEQSALSLAARARLLEACARTSGRLLARTGAGQPTKTPHAAHMARQPRHRHVRAQQSWGERLLLAAKVLVLSRLLISGIDEQTAKPGGKAAARGSVGSRPALAPSRTGLQDSAILASIEASKRTLGSLRRRLRDIVDIIERSVPTTAVSQSASARAEDDNGNNAFNGDDDTVGDEGDDEGDDGSRRAGLAEIGEPGRDGLASSAASARDDLLRALCAYSLATTSGARDVLWQLLHVRSQAMALAFEMDDEDHESRHQQHPHTQDCRASWKANNILRGLTLYTRTLLDVQALLPHRLPEALLGLKRRALLDDEALRQIEDLRLDVLARWCGEDVQYFKPYIQHDDLDAAQAREMLSRWADRGSAVLLAGLEKALAQQPPSESQQQPSLAARHQLDLHAIVDLRLRVLQLWIRDSSKARGFDPSVLLDKLRDVFNRHLLQALKAKVAKLRLVGSEVAATLSSWHDGTPTHQVSLWGAGQGTEQAASGGSGGGLDTNLTDGAVPFVRDVVARLHGRNDAVARAVASYGTWCHVVDDIAATLEQLRHQRWDNDVDDIVEDEETIAQRQQILSRQDPQALHNQLQAALGTAFQELDAQIVAAWKKVAGSDRSEATKGRIAMYLVRVLREIKSRRPAAAAASGEGERANSALQNPAAVTSSAAMGSLGHDILPELHATIVHIVTAPPLQQFASEALTRKTVAGRALWEGEGLAALPSTPSPGVFKLLRDLSVSMADAGADLWCPAAVAKLKQHVSDQLGEHWTALLRTAEYLREDASGPEPEPEPERDAEKEKGQGPASPSAALRADQRHDLFVQWLFDVAWLRCSLGAPGADVPSSTIAAKDQGYNTRPTPFLAGLEDAIYERTGLAKGADGIANAGKTPRQRVAKSAHEFWKKTSLLFGLLA